MVDKARVTDNHDKVLEPDLVESASGEVVALAPLPDDMVAEEYDGLEDMSKEELIAEVRRWRDIAGNRKRKVHALRMRLARIDPSRALEKSGGKSPLFVKEPDMYSDMLAAWEAGATNKDVANIVGISESTIEHWVTLGKQGIEPYEDFVLAYNKAKAKARLRAIAALSAQMPKSWRAAIAYLERRDPENWGRHAGGNATQNNIQINVVMDV